MKKFEKSEIQNLFSVKGGATVGEKTMTKPGETREWINDKDSNAGIEARAEDHLFSPVEP